VTFSIITVCFNAANTIKETLSSVIQQDHPSSEREYIVIDGGSHDGSQAIVQQYQGVTAFISEPDQGLYDALNKGIRLAKNEIIGFLHADDLYAHSQVLSKVATIFQDPKVDACYADLIYFAQEAPDKIVRYWRSGPFVPGLFGKGWNPPHPTFFVRRRVYEAHGGFDTRFPLGNDIELMMRFLEKKRIHTVYLPEVLVKMRLGGISNRSMKNILIQNKAILHAARQLEIDISPLRFWVGKISSRLLQFVIR